MDLHPDSCDFSNGRLGKAVAAEMQRLLNKPFPQIESISCEGYVVTKSSIFDDFAYSQKKGLDVDMVWDISSLGRIFLTNAGYTLLSPDSRVFILQGIPPHTRLAELI